MKGKLENGRLVPAPLSLEGYSPIPATVLERHGYRDVVQTPPDCEEGFRAELTGWDDSTGQIVAQYRIVQNPPPVRTYSRLKLYAALSSMGLWEPLVAWMKTQEVDGVNVWTAFNLANELADDHPLFAGYLRQAQTALGLTDAQVAAILEGCRND